jgi:mono/diheme cytochrome c family protein
MKRITSFHPRRLLTAGIGCATLVLIAACSTTYDPLADYAQRNPATQLDPPAAREQPGVAAETVEQGRYLVGLLGCGSCHTNGALVGMPNMSQLLAGSDTGIAFSNPLAVRNPGIVYPANITPDVATGIGSWSVDEIVAMIKSGVDKHSGQTLPVMPWPSFSHLTDVDAEAIAAYLLSLPPVQHEVPANVRPGQRATAPFVHFGVYQSKAD